MAHNHQRMTLVKKEETLLVTHEKRTFLIFSWYRKVYTDKFGQDLVIETIESFDRVILNGKELK